MTARQAHRKRGAWHDDARALHAANPGWAYARIARDLGVSASAVQKALNPELARKYSARAEAKPGRQEAKRAWERTETARGRCERCGELRGTAAAVKGYRLCRPCEHLNRAEIHETRLSLVEGMWTDGWPVREISETLGYATRTGANPYIDQLRKAGRIGFRYAACAERPTA
jgi:AraC-like DNA-binding protein